ncbi:tubby-like protein 4 [Amborella trichopoda]|uniref:tubby-like protein 4 n=1 Tax=Amborella trichopoda TaxID=13333 RepID=UPI0005D2E2AC|nr:tubby-like protein 4 [Amborella trichopoda]|eukprot:XP_011623909.1 tubby-like protein 4 [Amborella trichopoda]
MADSKKPNMGSHQPSYKTLYTNPLNELKHENSINGRNLGLHLCRNSVISGKENAVPSVNRSLPKKKIPTERSKSCPRNGCKQNELGIWEARVLKPSSLQVCMKLNERESRVGQFGERLINSLTPETSIYDWEYSDTEAAPASSWSTLPNRSLLCRPLPIDIGRCTCFIERERLQELNGVYVYSLYTNEGHGRQDRKLAIALHRRRSGRSEFIVAQNFAGILSSTDDGFLGTVTANLMGSRYHIWGQGKRLDLQRKQLKQLLAVIGFIPTVTTWMGRFRSMRAWIPKHQSMQLKSTTQIQHINGLPKNWEEKSSRAHQLVSKVPRYNKNSKRYELDFRERGRAGLKIQPSVKNFQLTMEENGRQSIVLLGKIGKSKYVMDYRFPLTGYQAFCICLTSIDSKLCCFI